MVFYNSDKFQTPDEASQKGDKRDDLVVMAVLFKVKILFHTLCSLEVLMSCNFTYSFRQRQFNNVCSTLHILCI